MAEPAGIDVICPKHDRWIVDFYRESDGSWNSMRVINVGEDDVKTMADDAISFEEARGVPIATAIRRHFLDRGGVLESRHRGAVYRARGRTATGWAITGWEIECAACRRDRLRVRTARFEAVLNKFVAQGIHEVPLDTLARSYRRASSI